MTTMQRQDICERFGITRHTLNNLLAHHVENLSFPQYINTIRLEEALHLLRNNPQLLITSAAFKITSSGTQ